MTKEEKQLLLKDLSTRLSYGVICHTDKGDGYLCSINQTIFGTEYGLNISPVKRDYFNDSEQDEVVIKPYLRPMESMTEEEVKEFYDVECMDAKVGYIKPTWNWHYTINGIDWLLEHHFDFRGLISKDLALEAPEGMYENF